MSVYDALFEDEDDIFGGTPQSKYWDIAKQVSEEVTKEEFDAMITKIAAMERMLMEQYGEETLDRAIDAYVFENSIAIDEHKKSLYMEYAGRLIYKLSD